MGRDDAELWLAGTHDGDGPWRLSSLEALTAQRQ
jgi:hypothetical protein